jgi:Xaa-Pro aminopeptidase
MTPFKHEEAPIPGGHAVIHGEEKVEHVEAGMILAVGNCGIYREQFGVRAEDTVWVSPDGPIQFTPLPQAITRVSRWPAGHLTVPKGLTSAEWLGAEPPVTTGEFRSPRPDWASRPGTFSFSSVPESRS